MKFETLNTERLKIRRLSLKDAKDISHYRSLPEVSEFQSWTEYSTEKALELIQGMENSDPSIQEKWFQFGVALKNSNELIGDIGFLNTDSEKKSWIGFTLNSKYWGQGYALEAVKEVLNYYSKIGITEVWASTDPNNHSSKKLLKKLNFKLVEEKPNDHIFVCRSI
jgi:RimJ/RimL family protein N-acetyltransferase